MSEDANSKPAFVKRKAKAGPSTSRKRLKTHPTSLDGLPWKAVRRPSETGLDGDDGILELEEVENVEVVYEDTAGGRVMKFNVSCRSQGRVRWVLISAILDSRAIEQDKKGHRRLRD
jgi:ATP-dependent RNA helicase DDX24/MAK5